MSIEQSGSIAVGTPGGAGAAGDGAPRARRWSAPLAVQIFAVIGAAFTLVFAANFLVSLDSTRRFLIEQLATHAQDTATSLGLSLSPHLAAGDLPVMESMVDAIFDRGYYREIVVTAADGRPLVDRVLAVRVDGVPGWFVSTLPLVTPRASAAVMDGWREGGRVSVMSHPGLAYRELWRTFRRSLGWSLGALAVALALAWLVLRATLDPLRALEARALEIGEGRFASADPPAPAPRTRELARVTAAMEDMGRRIERTLAEQSARIEALRRETFTDPVTGLGNRRALERQLADDAAGRDATGAVMLLRVGALDAVNRARGYAGGDAVLREAARVLREALGAREASLARLAGGDLAAIVPGADEAEARRLAEEVVQRLASLLDVEGPRAHAGVVLHGRAAGAGSCLGAADLALREAELAGPCGVAVHALDGAGAVPPAREWPEIVAQAASGVGLALVSRAVRTPDGRTVIGTRLGFELALAGGTRLAERSLAAMAARSGDPAGLDRALLERALGWLAAGPAAGGATGRHAVRIGAAAAAGEWLAPWLAARLEGREGDARRLALSVDAAAAVTAGPALERLAGRLRDLGVGLWIEGFGMAGAGLDDLRRLRPELIELHPGLANATTGAEREYLAALVAAARELGVAVIAGRAAADAPALAGIAIDGFADGAPAPGP